jgi:hypothetical protein
MASTLPIGDVKLAELFSLPNFCSHHCRQWNIINKTNKLTFVVEAVVFKFQVGMSMVFMSTTNKTNMYASYFVTCFRSSPHHGSSQLRALVTMVL